MRTSFFRLALGLLLLAVAPSPHAQTIPRLPPPGDVTGMLSQPEPARIRGVFTFAAAGDLIISQPMVPETLPGLERTWAVLRAADVAFANMETPPVDERAVHTFPNGDALLRGPAELAADARAMGFSLMSLANNHTTDLGPQAALSTRDLFERVGVATAGLGATLEEARRPGFLKTPRGRVAVVAVATTVKPNSMAQDALPDWPARPGVNVLHVSRVVIVTPAEMRSLISIARRQSYGRYRPPAEDATEIDLGGVRYRTGSAPGITWEMNGYDRHAVLEAVRRARREADFVVFSIHAHESDTGIDDDNPKPADFLVRLFHEAVQAGADIVVGGGPHGNRGVEIYRGKPVLYGMGVFTMSGKAYFSQEAQLLNQPSEHAARELKRDAPLGSPRSWYESMIVVAEYADGELAELRIHPLDLGGRASAERRGRPVIAVGPEASRRLELTARDSAQFGTRIEYRDGIGVIRVPRGTAR